MCSSMDITDETCRLPAPGYYFNGDVPMRCSEGCEMCDDANTCTKCEYEYTLVTKSSICTRCDASCDSCESDANTCRICAIGYYKAASEPGVCTSCEHDSNGVWYP